MLIKGEKASNISYGSTLASDGFVGNKFDFMLSNPPYGKTWKIDESAIVEDRGKKGKEHIKDPRFQVGLPSISDGQLLFLVNMISKMKTESELGSRIATVHNGSALFTGDAGQGESNIRKMILENDLLECIIALPTNIFYNTGIPTYVWILSNRKEARRRGKVQLINATSMYQKLRKNLGSKNCELTPDDIKKITEIYMNFEESDTSKIFDYREFGYYKICVERPLRLKVVLSDENVMKLRFPKGITDEAMWVYERFGEDVYISLEQRKKEIEFHFEKEESPLSSATKNKLFDVNLWNCHREYIEIGKRMQKHFNEGEYLDFNRFKKEAEKFFKGENLSKAEQTYILSIFSEKCEEAEKVIAKESKGEVVYEVDSELRDTENVPLTEDIQTYFEREVLHYVPDAWIDESKTQIGYSISFNRYFYTYTPPRSLEEIAQEIATLQEESEGLLEAFLHE